MSDGRTGPLSDLRILDLTQALAGPFGTALLADLGADVVKIEPPHGDMARTAAPFPKDYAAPGSSQPGGCDFGAYFASVNRNKRSVVLDVSREEDRERFLALAETADAVVENSRAGVMDRLGRSSPRFGARSLDDSRRWRGSGLQVSVYKRMVLSSSRARACFGLGIVVTSKVGASLPALGARQVLRTILASSC